MSARTRLVLLALGVALVVAVGFWRMRGRASDPAAPTASDRAGSSTATGPGPAGTRPRIDPRSGSTVKPAAGADEVDDGDGDPDTRTYVMDNGAVIRDHRGSGYAPPINPPPMPPDKRTMNTQLTAKIYQQLAPIVAACGGAVPTADRGGDPFTYVTMTVKVEKGQLTTTDVYPTIHDINGTSADAFPACVADKAKAIAIATGDEPDHSDYIVQYPIRLR